MAAAVARTTDPRVPLVVTAVEFRAAGFDRLCHKQVFLAGFGGFLDSRGSAESAEIQDSPRASAPLLPGSEVRAPLSSFLVCSRVLTLLPALCPPPSSSFPTSQHVVLRHVDPLLPYISDTGTLAPERCVFGIMLDVSSFLVFVSSVILYSSLPGVDVARKLHWTLEKLSVLPLSVCVVFQGYTAHLVSTVSEWSLAFSFISFFLTFIRDFQKIELRAEAVVQSTHLYDGPPGGAASHRGPGRSHRCWGRDMTSARTNQRQRKSLDCSAL
ncbi:hypothetical protein WMY93_033550 [Mugilogobius chulae]|uniref:CWH43-like N-terminal domain-containing protein n=1 Tax=Mugilogobius chulae TaxID=88201 RepID=A0AAW0MJW7_9GOBI